MMSLRNLISIRYLRAIAYLRTFKPMAKGKGENNGRATMDLTSRFRFC